MELTAIAQWLNTAFAGYDYAILQALHNLAEAAGGFFTPLCRAITLLGEKGILFLVLGIPLHRGNEVGDEIGPPLVLVDHLGPGRLHLFVVDLDGVVAAA